MAFNKAKSSVFKNIFKYQKHFNNILKNRQFHTTYLGYIHLLTLPINSFQHHIPLPLCPVFFLRLSHYIVLLPLIFFLFSLLECSLNLQFGVFSINVFIRDVIPWSVNIYIVASCFLSTKERYFFNRGCQLRLSIGLRTRISSVVRDIQERRYIGKYP